jgi:hypothetical protein
MVQLRGWQWSRLNRRSTQSLFGVALLSQCCDLLGGQSLTEPERAIHLPAAVLAHLQRRKQ